MQHRKFFELCKSLDKTTLKDFETYVMSPYFNKNKKVVALFTYLKKFHPTFQHLKLTKEKAFQAIYPNKTFKEQTFKNLLSDLSKLLEQFFIQEELKETSHYQKYLLLDGLYKRQQYKLFAQKLAQWQKEAHKIQEQDARHWYHQYILERYAYSFQVAQKGRLNHTNLFQVIHQLDAYYVVEKLWYYCVSVNHKLTTIDKEQGQELIETPKLLALLNTKDIDQIAVIQLYKALINLLKTETLAAYQSLKDFLIKQPTLLSIEEMRQVYTAILNHCNKQLKSGQSMFLQEIFDWYKIMLANGNLLSEGYITPAMHFRNMVMAGLRLGQMDWVATFIQNHQDKINPKQKESFLNYCLAALAFYQKDYATTLQHLSTTNFEDVYNHLENRVLLAKTYYELKEWDALESLLHSFRIYVTRDKVVPIHFQKPYLMFIKYVEKLAKQTQENLLSQVTTLTHVKDREWLLEKINKNKNT